MEISSTFNRVGSVDLHIINLCEQPHDVDFEVFMSSKNEGDFDEKIYADISITLKKGEEATYTNSSIMSLAVEKLRLVSRGLWTRHSNKCLTTTDERKLTISALRGITCRDCALTVVKEGASEKAVLFLSDDVFGSTDAIVKLAASKFPYDQWKLVSYGSRLCFNRKFIQREIDELLAIEDKCKEILKKSVLGEFWRCSCIDIISSATKAGKGEEIFTGDRDTSFIPKTLHQIYFGCDPDAKKASRLPLDFETNVKSWLEKNRPTQYEEVWEHVTWAIEERWEHVIWTMEERWESKDDYISFKRWCKKHGVIVKDLSDVYRDQEDWKHFKDVIDTALDVRNWGLASDIARFIVLKEEGGVYSDLDVECYYGLDRTEVMNSDFFMGLCETPSLTFFEGAIMGAQKGSVVFIKALEMIRRYKENGLMEREGMGTFSTIRLTGPVLLRLIVFHCIAELAFPRIYPPSVFYRRSSSSIAFHTYTNTWTHNEIETSAEYLKTWEEVTVAYLRQD